MIAIPPVQEAGPLNHKRLLLVVAAYFPDSYGGAERQALILAEALGRAGVDVTIVAPSIWADAPDVEETNFGRVVRRRVRAYPNRGGFYLASFLAWTLWFPRRFGGGEFAGVPIYVFHARLHALGPMLAALAGRSPLMVKLGGGGEASDFAALRAKKFFYGTWIQSLLLKHVDCFVANGDQIVQDLRDLGVPQTRIANFPNGVVLPDADQLATALQTRRGDTFIFMGRMIVDKRVHVLHQAALMLLDAPRPARMVFLGDGPECDRLAALPESMANPEAVAFPGFVSDVYPELARSDFFVSASMREGQSNALLEAMSIGVIPIVYNASGVTDVVTHGKTGFIVDTSEPEDFAATMRAALALTPEQRRDMAMAARRFAEENIGIDSVASRTIAVLDSLTANKEAR